MRRSGQLELRSPVRNDLDAADLLGRVREEIDDDPVAGRDGMQTERAVVRFPATCREEPSHTFLPASSDRVS